MRLARDGFRKAWLLAEERANDALLAHADVISRTSAADRQVVLSLFRQGYLIGLADRYQKSFDLTY